MAQSRRSMHAEWRKQMNLVNVKQREIARSERGAVTLSPARWHGTGTRVNASGRGARRGWILLSNYPLIVLYSLLSKLAWYPLPGSGLLTQLSTSGFSLPSFHLLMSRSGNAFLFCAIDQAPYFR